MSISTQTILFFRFGRSVPRFVVTGRPWARCSFLWLGPFVLWRGAWLLLTVPNMLGSLIFIWVRTFLHIGVRRVLPSLPVTFWRVLIGRGSFGLSGTFLWFCGRVVLFRMASRTEPLWRFGPLDRMEKVAGIVGFWLGGISDLSFLRGLRTTLAFGFFLFGLYFFVVPVQRPGTNLAHQIHEPFAPAAFPPPFKGKSDGFRLYQVFRFFSFFVHPADFLGPFHRDRKQFATARHRIPHDVLENILFYQVGIAFHGLKVVGIIRKIFQSVQIGVQFIVQAAFQPAALAAQLGLVDGEVLVTGRIGVHAF